ncbi:MAG TPA: SARP family transcriptional regulator, partial [Anaerolineae bacterium]|nr:SARP family transcriptional regulator [Anaerolineae bacterium]
MFTLHFFGGFNAAYSGKPLTGFATDKVRALLVYLALENDRPHRRESLASLFWPEQPEERARQSLRQALSNLRQALAEQIPAPFLNVTNTDVQMSAQAEVWTDVQAFRALLCESREHAHT